MQKKPGYWVYWLIRSLVKLFYRKPTFCGLDNLPKEPSVIVSNHCQMNGPIIAEVFFPGEHKVWCTGEMMHLKEVPGYAFQDFWSFKPRWTHPFYRLLSYIIAPISVGTFNNAHTIPVYRDGRILTTYRETIKRLEDGANVIIFPERNEKRNNILYAFQEGFVDIARLYYKKTGKTLNFVPMYIAPRLHRVQIGAPIRFERDRPLAEERSRVCEALADAITRMATELPPHTVVPYRNIPRRDYPKNRIQETPDP